MKRLNGQLFHIPPTESKTVLSPLAKPVFTRRVIFARLADDTDSDLCREHPGENDRGRISALFEWRGVGGQCLPPMARAFCAALSVSTRCRSIPRSSHPGAIDVLRPRGLGGIPGERLRSGVGEAAVEARRHLSLAQRLPTNWTGNRRSGRRVPGKSERVTALMHLFAAHLVERYTDVASEKPEFRGGLQIGKLRRVEDYVRERLAEDIPVEALAELVDLSPFHFSRMFKQVTGMSPLQFVVRERIVRAQKLICETSRSLIEIGLEVGYTSPIASNA